MDLLGTVVLLPLAALPGAGVGQVAVRVLLAPIVGVLLLTTAVALAVTRPWGQTRFRRRQRPGPPRRQAADSAPARS